MKTILKQLTAALLMVSLVPGQTIRTLRPDGGGMRPADRTPFMDALGVTPLGKASLTRPTPAGPRFVQLNSDGTETLLDAAGFKTAIGAGSGGDITAGPVRSSAGTSTVQDAGLTIAKTSGLQTALNSKRTVFNIQNYGATPNDGTDDTAAIQACVAAAKIAKGPIYAPYGTYNTNGIAFMLDWEGAELFGDGCPDRGIAGAGGTQFSHVSLTRPCIMVPADYNDVRIRDLRVSGQTAVMSAWKTFTVDASTDTFTCAGHGYSTGDMVMMTPSTGASDALPTAAVHGLSHRRMYFIIRLDANTFKVSFNYARAMLGTANDITSAGVGTHSIRTVNCGIVFSGNSLQSGGSTDGQSNDHCHIDGVNVAYFNIGLYLEEFSNCSMRLTGGVYCYYGMIIDGNSASLITSPAASVAATGSVGIWMAGGWGSSIVAGDLTGDGDIGILIDGSDATAIVGCNFEARGTRCIVSRSNSTFTMNACYMAHHGTATADTYALEIGPEVVTITDCAFGMVSSVTGAAIKQRQTASRNLTMHSARTVKADVFSNGTYFSTYTMATSGIGTGVQASGEPANVNNWGHLWRKVNTGAQDNLFISVKDPTGSTYEYNDLFKYWYDGGRTGVAAFRHQANTFTASPQTVSAAANPYFKIITGSDAGVDRFSIGQTTTGNAFGTGTNTGDSSLSARSGGRLTFATAPAAATQIMRGYFSDTGNLELLAQAATNGTSAMTRDLVDARVTSLVSGPKFWARTNAIQSVPDQTNTRLNWGAEDWDTANAVDTTNGGRFNPQKAGYYQINISIRAATNANSTQIILYKNGAFHRFLAQENNHGFATIAAAALVQMNGTTDYLEVWLWHNKGSALDIGTADGQHTQFSGAYIP